MPIFAVNGKIGHGKGCVMTWLAIRQADKGRAVYANWPIFDPRIQYIERWEEVCDLDNADVFLDEMHLWFPSRDWQKLGKPEDLLRWSQARHDGLNIYWCSQNPSQVDLQIREVFTHWVYYVKRCFGPDSEGEMTAIERILGPLAVINKYEASEFRLATKRQSVYRKWINLRQMWGKFDTHHVIGFRDGSGVRAGRGRLPSVRGNGPVARVLTPAEYDRGRFSHPNCGLVSYYPEPADAIAQREKDDRTLVSEGSAPNHRNSGNSGSRLVSRFAPEDDGAPMGDAHPAGHRRVWVRS